MARPRLPTLARHYSEAATAAAATGSEEVQDAPVPPAYWHRHLTLIQHVLGLGADEATPRELRKASKLKGSAMFDALIVALDVESTIDNLPWSKIKEHGATAIGVSILDTRHLLHELRCDTHEARDFNSIIQPLQFYFRDGSTQSRIYAKKRVSKFSFGQTERLQANQVSTKLKKLFDGRDVITVFHNSHNDTTMLKYLGFDTSERSLVILDTWRIAEDLGLPTSLGHLSTLLFVDPGNKHVAGDDAMATVKTLSMLAALVTDPLISTPSPQGAQLGRLVLGSEADFSWLAGQFPQFLGRNFWDPSTQDANTLKRHLMYLVDDMVRARQSLDKEVGWLELRHWRLRQRLAQKQLSLYGDSINTLLLQKLDSQRTLQKEEQHPQPLPQQSAPSAESGSQPLPLPSTDTAETSRLMTTTAAVNRHDDDVELILIRRTREGFDARLFSRHIDHVVRVRHHLHQQCLSIILLSMQAKCSIFIHRWERWAVSRHEGNRYHGKKFLTLTRPFFQGMMGILSHQVERTPSALREKSIEQLNNLVCPSCQMLLQEKSAKSFQTLEELLLRPEILWPFPQHLYGPLGSISATRTKGTTRLLPPFPQHLYGYGGIIRSRHMAEGKRKRKRKRPLLPFPRHLYGWAGSIRSRHKAEDKMAWKSQSQPASTIGTRPSALAWEAAWAGKVIVR